MGELCKLIVTLNLQSISLISNFNYSIKDGWLEIFDLSDVFSLKDGVEFPKCSSQKRVEMVFY